MSVRGAEDLRDDACGNLAGDVVEEVERPLSETAADDPGGEFGDAGAHPLDQLEREGARDRRAASAMRLAVREQHAGLVEVVDRPGGDALDRHGFELHLARQLRMRRDRAMTMAQGDIRPERRAADRRKTAIMSVARMVVFEHERKIHQGKIGVGRGHGRSSCGARILPSRARVGKPARQPPPLAMPR